MRACIGSDASLIDVGGSEQRKKGGDETAGGLAHYVIAAAAVASHNVKHAWVLAWVASRFAASSCHLRFSHFAIVLQFS